MSRLLIFIYGLISYAVGLGGLVWFALFVGGWEFLPRHIDSDIPGPLTMTVTHLLLSAPLIVYVLMSLKYEEKDLVTTLGENYEDYQKRVRMIIPLPK